MNPRRVAVTGLGIVASLGDDPDTFFAALMAGRSGIGRLKTRFAERLETRIAAQVEFDPAAHFTKLRAAILDRVTQFAIIAARRALAHAALELEREDRSRAGVCMGTGMGSAGTIDASYLRLYGERADRLKPSTVLMAMNNAAGAQIALDYGLSGPNVTYTAACSSSTIAIGEAWRMVRDGRADLMLAGGTEALLTFGTMKAWEGLRTMAQEDPVDPAASCKPFAKNRSGLVLGEGAAVVVLEPLERARARGAAVHGEIIGYASGSDSVHITKPSPEGQARAMQAALDSAGIGADAIDYINAHGTATLLNDATETAAIRRVFGERAYSVPVSSTKSMTGHLMGAAGAVEFVVCLQALKHQAIPPTAHLVEADPECDLDYVPNAGRSGVPVRTAMSNSFAFGGTTGVLIVQKT